MFLLDSIASYDPSDAKDAESIVERVTPRLQHANSAVVLSAVKVIIKMIDHLQSGDMLKSLGRKMAPPLVTLLSAEPEIQYVALRNINLIIQKHRDILAHEVKVFFCKYNDPIYVKMEKLEIMIKLANANNIDQVSECASCWVGGWTGGRGSQRASVRARGCAGEWAGGWVVECMSERVCKCVMMWASVRVSDWVPAQVVGGTGASGGGS